MKPIVLTENQILVLTYIKNNGIVTSSDRPIDLEAKLYNTTVLELIDKGLITDDSRGLRDYYLRLSPALIYNKIFSIF